MITILIFLVLKDHNVPIITVTSNIHSKLAVNSDIVLQLPDDESFDEKVASFASQQIWYLFLITSILSFSRKLYGELSFETC